MSTDLASRMYPNMSTPAAPAPGSQPASAAPEVDTTPARADTPPSAAPASGSDLAAESAPAAPSSIDQQVDEYLDRELSLGEQMYSQAGVPLADAGEYSAQVLSQGFDQYETQARTEGNVEDVANLAEGRQVAAGIFADWNVPAPEAREATIAMRGHFERFLEVGPLHEDAIDAGAERAEAELRAEWGKHYDAKVALAQRAAKQAAAKAPWLEPLIRQSAAGNDPKLIRLFAQWGERNARRGRARK